MHRPALLAVSLLALAAASPRSAAGPISASRMDAMDKVIASEAFQGRAPGTPGETRTIA